MFLISVTIYAALVPMSAALADDTMARVAAGGITFVQSEDVRMLKETLEISTKKIRVKFTFLNESDKDIRTTVAFPLPPICTTDHWQVEKRLLTSFTVRVDGRSVATTVVRKAVIGDKDVTASLQAIGLSDAQIFQISDSNFANDLELTPNQTAAIKKLGKNPEQFPPWDVSVTMIWDQTFPAGKEIIVEHSYAPIIGAVYTVPFGDGSFSEPPWIPVPIETTDEACIDELVRKGIEKQVRAYAKRKPKEVFVTLHHVEYILSTGRNWKGPIGEFILRIEKETPDQIVSLCFPGKPEKTGPTVSEFYEKDFVPPDRLVVYLYMVAPAAKDPHDHAIPVSIHERGSGKTN
jgi:hypothetical protein